MRLFAPLALLSAFSLAAYACVGDDVPATAVDAGTTPQDASTTPETGTPETGTPPPQDAGADPDDPKVVCAAIAKTIPASAPATPEVFGPKMIGCPGKIAYAPNVAKSCGAGWSACSAVQAKARPVNQVLAPKYHYWLDPRLWASPSGDTGRCYAAPAVGIPTAFNCGNNSTGSMHFCSKLKLTAQDRYSVADDLGNTCAQVNCDYNPPTFTSSTDANNAQPTNGDFGGCGNNETAGVLCCKN